MAKVVECAKVDPASGCDHVISGETDDEVVQRAGEHARTHGMVVGAGRRRTLDPSLGARGRRGLAAVGTRGVPFGAFMRADARRNPQAGSELGSAIDAVYHALWESRGQVEAGPIY